MALMKNLVFDVREAIKEYSDDTEIDSRYIKYLYNIKRAKYLRQDLNNFQKTTDISIQQEFCLGLEEVTADQCSTDIYCDKILRTTKPLPKAIELHTKPAITKIKPSNRIAVPFNFVQREKIPFLQHSRFSKSIYAFIDIDNYVYIVSKSDTYKLLDCINVAGIFEDPFELKDYSNCCNCGENNSCYDEDNTNYPLQPHYIDLIKREIVQELVGHKQMPEDNVNDSTTPTYAKE